MAIDLFGALTVLPPPSGAHVLRDLVYVTDAKGPLRAEVYRPATAGVVPAVFLVNGDGPEEVIGRANDWGVYRSYGEHLAARGIVAVPFNHRSRQGSGRTSAVAASVRAVIDFVRGQGRELGVDPDRIGVWAFSAAGPVGLAPLLRGRARLLRPEARLELPAPASAWVHRAQLARPRLPRCRRQPERGLLMRPELRGRLPSLPEPDHHRRGEARPIDLKRVAGRCGEVHQTLRERAAGSTDLEP